MERPPFDVGAVVAVVAYAFVSALSAALSFDDEYLPIVFGAVAPVIYSPVVAVVCAPFVPRLYRKLGRTRTLALCAFFVGLSVVPDAVDPACSRWILRTNQFGQDFEFSWVARDLPPKDKRKIAWESTEGLNNRGAVRFAEVPASDADATSRPPNTKVSIEISYEVPDPLVPFGAAVSPLVESILAADLKRFSAFAEKVVAALGKRKKAGK